MSRDFSALSFAPNFFPFTYLPHLISHYSISRAQKSLNSTELWGDVRHMAWGRWRGKARGVLHPKCGSEKREVNSFLTLRFFSLCFFSFFCLKRRCHYLHATCQHHNNSHYVPLLVNLVENCFTNIVEGCC
jgi:hypothetical protein